MTLMTKLIIITIVSFVIALVIMEASIGINKKTAWMIPVIAVLMISGSTFVYTLESAMREQPQIIADKLGIDADSVYFDEDTQLWHTDDANYRAVFTEAAISIDGFSISATTELKSLVKIGETVIK